MSKKLSNTADRKVIEGALGRTYNFPRLYQSNTIINGAEESLLSVVTMDTPDAIDYAIWGMLPTNYQDDWSDFQNAFDTLSIDERHLLSVPLYKRSFMEKRCLIIITGFFSYHVHEGVLYPYHIYRKKNHPFCVAGVYSILADGFITCSIINKKATGIVEEIQNVSDSIPLIISEDNYDRWLDPNLQEKELLQIMENSDDDGLNADPIAKELFNQNISFDSMLEPVDYTNVPGKFRNHT